MHDVAVALEGHELVDLLGAVVDDPPDVVAGQVHQHDMLGPLLRVLHQLRRQLPVVLVGPAPEAGPGDGPGYDPPVDELHHRLRRGTDHAQLGVAQEVHVRAGVDLAQRPVQVEGVGVEVQLEALRQHHLEDVAGQDVLFGHVDRGPEHLGRRPPAHVGQPVLPLGRDDQGLVDGGGALGRELVEPGHGGVVQVVEAPAVGGRSSGYGDRLDERDPLPPVVVRRHLAHHRQDGVRVALLVGGRLGEALDLAHHVVAEVADHAAVERGQGFDDRRAVGRQQGLHRGQHAPVPRDRVRQGSLDREGAAPPDQRGRRPAAHEGPAAPALGVLHGLEQEGPVAVLRSGQSREGGHRRRQVGQQLPPDGDHVEAGGERGELLARR